MAIAVRQAVRAPARTHQLKWVLLAGLTLGLLAAALRLSLLIRSNWLLEGDDALSALMALDVLDGDRPIMLKNQTYAAAWEPYTMALSYALFGISRVTAKLPALLGSLGLIGTTWLLAREVAGRSGAWFAACLMAVPPAYVLVLSLKPWAPYTEVMLFGSLALLCAVRLGWPRPGQHDAAWAFSCGIASGLALWMHPLAIWYLAPAALVVLLRVPATRLGVVASCGLLGCVAGGLPIWLYNLQTGGATARFILSGSQGQTADRDAVLQAWWNGDLPRGAGLWNPWGSSPLLLAVIMGVWFLASAALAVGGRRGFKLRRLDAVLIFLGLIPVIFVLSGFGGPALNPYGFDATGRYTPPIWSGLAVLGGAALGGIWQVRRWLAVGLAVVPIAINLAGIASIDPLAAFQSPYWDRLPADNGQLLAVLRDEQIDAVVLNHWAGQPVMFDAAAAGQRLIAYDWYDVQAGGIDRFPEFLPLFRSAARSAYVLVTDETEPELERSLRRMGVAFVERRVSPYVVVIPTSRRVDPSEITGALDYRY